MSQPSPLLGVALARGCRGSCSTLFE
uniref:Uncharacterized protein n=1 Tax=Anguilla anguilla TaxID=7936 RepID=A0A0E9S162_ANGAN